MTDLDRLRASINAESLEAYRAEIDRLRARLAVVDDFCAERAQYVTALKQSVDGGADYHRWQGHAEARRQLSERLGLPTAWPSGYPGVAVPVEPKDPPAPPPPREEPGEWTFHGYDQMGLPTWSWRPVEPKETK